jgi:hypothetical protein
MQLATAIAEIAIALFACLAFIANVVSIGKFEHSLRLTRESLLETKQSREDAWKIAQGQMLLDANRDFFYQEPHKTLIRKLEMSDSLAGTADCDIDDHLGFLDTIGTFTRAGILNPALVWEVFSHYVEVAHENAEITEYLKRIRSESSGAGLFSDFEWLYVEMQSVGATKGRKK